MRTLAFVALAALSFLPAEADARPAECQNGQCAWAYEYSSGYTYYAYECADGSYGSGRMAGNQGCRICTCA